MLYGSRDEITTAVILIRGSSSSQMCERLFSSLSFYLECGNVNNEHSKNSILPDSIRILLTGQDPDEHIGSARIFEVGLPLKKSRRVKNIRAA